MALNTRRVGAGLDETHAMGAVARDLEVAFPSVPPDQVAVLVECLWHHFDGAPVRDFVPLLVRKQAHEELSDHLASLATSTQVPVPLGSATA